MQALNTFQPVVLVGYPSVMQMLAQEQLAGRLHITPMLVSTGGECLAAATRAQIAVAFGCMVRDNYGASEFMHIAFECKYDQLHLNTDWVILEPVDEEYQPMPPGQVSHTALLTNLANRVQPLIRYDLGDSITVNPDPCPCGSPFPAIRVEGRRDDILYMQAAGSTTIPILPMALSTVVEETPGVGCFQVIQTVPATLTVRLEVKVGADSCQVWETTIRRLRDYLLAQGVPSVQLERATDPPRRDRVSGKFRQVRSELQRNEEGAKRP